ncbi:beta-galactosidase [Spirochaeta dissipatitropha]
MTISEKIGMGKIAYGGDWNPEQWDEQTMLEDVRLFRKAGIDLLSINIFAWTLMQSDEETYSFDHIDRSIALLKENGMKVCLATATAAHPAWMAHKYPDVLRTDFQGRKRKFGDRHNSCPNSPSYRKYAALAAGKLAERYAGEETVLLWHVSNEFMGTCYCENCATAFRDWLKNKYASLKALNEAWNALFWNQTITDWEQIQLPNALTVQWTDTDTAMQGISLDYNRFNSDSILECYCIEHEAIKRHIPDAVITTNFMGPYRQLDYRRWAPHLDIISWDSYPAPHHLPSETAFYHSLMRGLKSGPEGAEPFLLMEQTPSQTNWQDYCSLKRPGVMRMQSMQAVAQGSDSVLFFQMRRSRGGCEKFHGAVIEHSGREDTRVFSEVSELGAELQKLGTEIIGARIHSEAAIWFDWDCWWGLENSMGPVRDLHYLDELRRWYQVFHAAGIQADVIGPGCDPGAYKILCAPFLYMLDESDCEALEIFVNGGGRLLSGVLSAVADRSDLVFRGGAPGPLKNVFGLWVEETDALPPEATNSLEMSAVLEGSYSCSKVFDIIRTETAEILGRYGSDFYAGRPAVCRNSYGQGSAWYIGSIAEDRFLQDLCRYIAEDSGVKPLVPALPDGVEVSQRRSDDGSAYLFLLNHNDHEVTVHKPGLDSVDLLSGDQLGERVSIDPRSLVIAKI